MKREHKLPRAGEHSRKSATLNTSSFLDKYLSERYGVPSGYQQPLPRAQTKTTATVPMYPRQ
jgi:hypothetical protein